MTHEELIWKYAEGTCTPEEKSEAEALLATDPNLRQEFESIRQVHTTLQNMEPEQPSMRFVQNLMEALPKLYGSLSAEPLVKPFWKKAFAGVLAGMLALAIWLGVSQPAGEPSLLSPFIDRTLGGIQSVLAAIPGSVVTYAFWVFAAIAILVVIDKMMAATRVKI
jgi:anti-sigma factor RsiW